MYMIYMLDKGMDMSSLLYGTDIIPKGVGILLALMSLLVGILECFAGYKLVKVMTAIWAFIAGVGVCVGLGILCKWYETSWLIIAFGSLVVGILFGVIAYELYRVGVFLFVFAMTFISMKYIIGSNILPAFLTAVVIAVVSVFFMKLVIVVSTSASGAISILKAVFMLMGVSYDINFFTALLWIVIAGAGVFCQYTTTRNINSGGRKNGSTGQRQNSAGATRAKMNGNAGNHNNFFSQFGVKGENSPTFSELKYPGMQRAYRNFCINCGCELSGSDIQCPRCGYKICD